MAAEYTTAEHVAAAVEAVAVRNAALAQLHAEAAARAEADKRAAAAAAATPAEDGE